MILPGLRRHGRRLRRAARSAAAVLVDTTCGSVLNVWKQRREVRARRLHLPHPRQVGPRGDARHRLAGAAVPRRALPRRPRHGRGRARLPTTSSDGGDRDGVPRPVRAARCRRASTPTATSQRIGVANQTTMLSSESLDDRARGPRARWSAATARRTAANASAAFDTICSATQDRQDARRGAARGAARPADRDRRLQLVATRRTWREMCAATGADVPHRGPDGLVSADVVRHRPVGGHGRGRVDGVAARAARDRSASRPGPRPRT